ncbi:MAG: hypothetical protein CSB32_00700 [Desulfobacterales bacterium]|nr:MAG: hypothetical protein CSB32_00700 [Desulfobacterales bacterium]
MLVPENTFCSLVIENLKERVPAVKRLVFTVVDTHDYKVELLENNLKISIAPGSNKAVTRKKTPAGLRSLTDFEVSSTPNSTTVTIVSNGPVVDYTVGKAGSGVNTPPRMFIDIDDVAINELTREKLIGTKLDKIRVAPRGKGARIVFDSAGTELFNYTVATSPKGLSVVIDESGTSPASGKKSSRKASQEDGTLLQLIDSSEQLLSQDPEILMKKTKAKADTLAEDFSYSGYKKKRISVDFYKIDIHNVFRLFREISDLNIIVDEEVSGVLTLALSDVPWDFALDIILNLMGLKKEERFNTLVIYPAEKEFIWPTRAEDNLAFEADLDIIEQESLIIEKTVNQSPAVVEAKDLMLKAQKLERQENFEDAVLLYTKALELWPDNESIANRISGIYLVNLGMNAKALFFARKALEKDPGNTQAALHAAIGSANMQNLAEAKEYFAQSVSGSPPMKEALLSYAAFSENNGQWQSALKLLEKYNTIYGETVDTMVAMARIYDATGNRAEAAKQYGALLNSGFQLRPDLKKYIQGRLSTESLY